MQTSWQDDEVAREFVEVRRSQIPFGDVQIELMMRLIDHFRPDVRRVLDLGCGDGILSRAVLSRYLEAKAVLVDHSKPMLARARTASAALAVRCNFRLHDLMEPIGPGAEPGVIDVVVSGYAIHHLPHARKRSLYEEIHEALAPGGLFINIEHVASATRELEALWDEAYIDYIAEGSDKPRSEVAAAHHARPDKADNTLLDLETQLDWLRAIGFTQVDCAFRYFELAVFCGRKAA